MRAGAADAVAGFVGARDATPPTVNVLYPNGGETIPAESSVNVTWTATDENQIGSIDVFVTFDGGATFDTIALGLPGTQTTVTWFPANRPTTTARIRVEATDVTLNTGSDESDAAFTVTAVPGGTVPTTLRDFDQPGTQPFEHGIDIRDPGNNCAGCHGNYDPAAEPYFAWRLDDGQRLARPALRGVPDRRQPGRPVVRRPVHPLPRAEGLDRRPLHADQRQRDPLQRSQRRVVRRLSPHGRPAL
ncbi:MAG: hypothetical protein H6816_04925 [Phycisphaerales bacterium]|nr:hypothetical protein [Phycisphaerales bacterium]